MIPPRPDWIGFEPTAELVRELLLDQHPDLAHHPLELAGRGWDNLMWRLGADLAVRLPWQTATADALLLKEHAWLPRLAPGLPLPVPVPQRLGRASERYPRPWIVTTWLDGTPADRAPPLRGAAAEALAGFLTALHQPSPSEAPGRSGRGGPLTQVAGEVERLLATLPDQGNFDRDAVQTVWQTTLEAPLWDRPSVWLHGDLHPANVLTTDGRPCGIIDFGDLCTGDPALDLAAAWILLPDAEAIERFRRLHPLAADEATWCRSRGWAVWRALVCLAVATAGPPGGKPSWGPPAVASLRRLTSAGS